MTEAIFGSGNEQWVCPNDRQLTLRAKQVTYRCLVEHLENMRRSAMGNGLSQCLLCGEEFGLLGSSSVLCSDCHMLQAEEGDKPPKQSTPKQTSITDAFEQQKKYDKNSPEARKINRAVAEFI
ncbi:hypothetical protein DNTS_031817 [Danionella cerebrum]|uniref:FYVE-type zinc finger domain-containing protein n=1 Tax=Danionella cerebrum TaxID=2873325 RepID=A0A553NAE3_9TELE|nr:hypothetical protein DNTS_031817 [Danionella translucida]